MSVFQTRPARIQLLQARVGFACNSSSMHSIIALPALDAGIVDEDAFDDDFGWNEFTLASSEAKMRYLAGIISAQMSENCGPFLAAALTREMLGPERAEKVPGIDHQSVFRLPVDHSGKLHGEFLEEFQRWLCDSRVLILGGNDNATHGHPLFDSGRNARPLFLETETDKRWIARRDEASDSWTLFCPSDGSKLRLRLLPEGDFEETILVESRNEHSFGDLSEEKLSAPELVDVKITDACPYRCAFCYQGSLPEGQHASLASIGLIADRLAQEQVFEVALGGGEPTLHPDFPEILEIFLARGITPNFTTRNLAWTRGPFARRILRACGAFAFSAQNAQEALRAIEGYNASLEMIQQDGKPLRDGFYSAGRKLTIQHVVGVAPASEIRSIAAACFAKDVHLTLLGYKENGRGESALSVPGARETLLDAEAGWIKAVRDGAAASGKRWARIGVDTALADRFASDLSSLGNGKELFRTMEGAQSAYIDAVALTIAPSSYSLSPPTPFDENWLAQWAGIAPESPPPRRTTL